MSKILKNCLLLALLCLLSACTSISYYSQSIIGHSRLMLAREPIDELILSAEPELKQRLQTAILLRQFAVEELDLPDNASYSSYVELQREYPVWTVVATGEFSLQPYQWCYPIIGCASYRGYFSRAAASEYAESLRARGMDVHVAGAAAYSTLGWFADPLLSSMMGHSDTALAETMFHELAHQVMYVKGETAINEAFASVVGEQGVLRWLRLNQPQQLSGYRMQLQWRAMFESLLDRGRAELSRIYASDLQASQMRQARDTVFRGMVESYQELLKTRGLQKGPYDYWFEKPINNARLAALASYRELMPFFNELLLECDDDFARFFAAAKTLKLRAATAPASTGCLAAK